MLERSIIQAYSKLHSPIEYDNGSAISFEGSQIQKEFFQAWSSIAQYYTKYPTKEISFLEIGAWKGLWGIAFSEFCNMYNIKGKYVTLTMVSQDPNNQGLYKSLDYITSRGVETHLIDENTMADGVLTKVTQYTPNYNIVFIDADHSYNAVMSDIKNFSPLATDILMFHDIRPRETTAAFGVYQAIQDSNIELDEEIVATIS